MAAQAEALAALEAKHEEEWREFRASRTQRREPQKKTQTNEFQLQQEESDLRYRQHEELEDLEGGDDAATVEEPAVVEDAREATEEGGTDKSQKISQGREEEVKSEAEGQERQRQGPSGRDRGRGGPTELGAKKECEAISKKLVDVNRRIRTSPPTATACIGQ